MIEDDSEIDERDVGFKKDKMKGMKGMKFDLKISNLK